MNAVSDAVHLLPMELNSVIEQWRRKAVLQPGLSPIHALALDRQLKQLNVSVLPVTVSAHGYVAGNPRQKMDQPPVGNYRSLHDAALYANSNGWSRAAGEGFQRCRDIEIPALNLLYANASLANEQLWLYFLNKFLAHQVGSNDAPPELALRGGAGSRVFRLAIRTPLKSVTSGPLVSVIMPAFNSSSTIKFAAQSILNQTWRNLELLIVDDSSTDRTREIANQLSRNDSRVRVFSLSQNSGPYVAKNLALKHARGQFLTVHDADDWAFPDRIHWQIKPLLSNASGSSRERASIYKASMAKMLRLSEDGIFTRFQPSNWVTQDGALRLSFPSPMFRRDWFDHVLGAWDSVRFGADLEIIQRIRRFDPDSLVILDTPVMLQLDLPTSLTRCDESFNDDRGESRSRADYRLVWTSRHARVQAMPKLCYPPQHSIPTKSGFMAPSDSTIFEIPTGVSW